jgi:hypothetical protein
MYFGSRSAFAGGVGRRGRNLGHCQPVPLRSGAGFGRDPRRSHRTARRLRDGARGRRRRARAAPAKPHARTRELGGRAAPARRPPACSARTPVLRSTGDAGARGSIRNAASRAALRLLPAKPESRTGSAARANSSRRRAGERGRRRRARAAPVKPPWTHTGVWRTRRVASLHGCVSCSGLSGLDIDGGATCLARVYAGTNPWAAAGSRRARRTVKAKQKRPL